MLRTLPIPAECDEMADNEQQVHKYDDARVGTGLEKEKRKRKCDHVFTVGSSRSTTGNAVFGDFSQRVILNVDGYTTFVTE